ncbi:hypothetical protein WA577_004206 [Blastocystis sp. JDR]
MHNQAVKGEDIEDDTAVITLRMALLYPILASIVLLGLFYFYSYVQNIMLLYVVICSVVCVERVVESLLLLFNNTIRVKPRVVTLISIIVSIIISFLWVYNASPFFNNVIGIALTICALSVIRVQNIKVITVVFVLLFIYDIFWVFFSQPLFKKNVMVTVAEQNFTAAASSVMKTVGKPLRKGYNLEFPAKLVLLSWSGKSMNYLGLGDIVIPGLLFCFCFFFQYYISYLTPANYDVESQPLHEETKSLKPNSGDKEPKGVIFEMPTLYQAFSLITTRNYVSDVMWGNIVGLLLSLLAVVLTGHAQPALLYLVPCCLVPICLRARKSNQLSLLWNGPVTVDHFGKFVKT